MRIYQAIKPYTTKFNGRVFKPDKYWIMDPGTRSLTVHIAIKDGQVFKKEDWYNFTLVTDEEATYLLSLIAKYGEE